MKIKNDMEFFDGRTNKGQPRDESLDKETIKIIKQMNKYRRKKANTDE